MKVIQVYMYLDMPTTPYIIKRAKEKLSITHRALSPHPQNNLFASLQI